MKVSWSRRAQRDPRRIKSYIGKRNPDAASDVSSRINGAADRLEQFPLIGPEVEGTALRLLQVPGLTYALAYRVGLNAIEILSVFDQRRNPEEKN